MVKTQRESHQKKITMTPTSHHFSELSDTTFSSGDLLDRRDTVSDGRCLRSSPRGPSQWDLTTNPWDSTGILLDGNQRTGLREKYDRKAMEFPRFFSRDMVDGFQSIDEKSVDMEFHMGLSWNLTNHHWNSVGSAVV